MRRRIEPAAVEVEADAGCDLPDEPLLVGHGIPTSHDGVVRPACRSDTLLDERYDRAAEPPELVGDGPPAAARLVVVEKVVVGIAPGRPTGREFPLEREHAFQPGLETAPRGFLPGRHPGVLRLDAGLGDRTDEPLGHFRMSREIAGHEADRRADLG